MHITYKGNELPLVKNWSVEKEFSKAKNIKKLVEIRDMFKDISYEDVETLLFIMLKHGHRKQGIPFTITPEEITDILDDDVAAQQFADIILHLAGLKPMQTVASVESE